MPIREALKGGWHPGSSGKDSGMGKGISVRRDFKGANQVAKLVGKGKSDTSAETAQNHHSAPLSTLKDPDSFGPPPRHVARAEPTTPVSSRSSAATRSYATTGQAAFPESKVLATAPAGGSWGAPLPQSTIVAQEEEVQEEEEKTEAPSVPYRANTTGLSTAGFAAPPVFQRPELVEDAPRQPPKPAPRAVPKPPPRLPPRQNSNPHELSEAPPPPYTAGAPRSPAAVQPVQQQPSGGYLNKGSLNRLGRAGVSVPGLDIGGSSAQPIAQHTSSEQPGAPPSGQLSELQARFNRMPGRVSSPTTQSPQITGAAAGGTTWAQKQAALRTASNFNKDPSSVSLSDAREAGSTMNNFRQRHGEQVATGMRQAQALDQKHGVSTRLGGIAQGSQQTGTIPAEEVAMESAEPVAPASVAAAKKAPPPPPKKKPGLIGSETADAPPPVPMASKPRQ